MSGYAASSEAMLNTVNRLASDLYNEAVKKFGKAVVTSKKSAHLSQIQRFLKGHPKYKLLMTHLKKLPNLILPKGKLLPTVTGNANFKIARHMRKQFFLANMKPGLSQRMGTIASGLNGKVRLMKGLGFATTWAIPAVLGVISVANAPADRRMRVFFEEGFGIIGGAIGTMVGAELVGVGIATFFCLGPFGAFVAIFICASALGLAFSEGSKYGVGKIIDVGDSLSGYVYHSVDDIIGAM